MLIAAALLSLAADPGQPTDFLREEQTQLLEFRYGWPAAVAAAPRLRALLQGEMERARAEAIATATETKTNAAREDYPFHTQSYDKVWQLAGRTERLLSLYAATGTYTGGAHPNTTYGALLWDAEADRANEITILLGDAALQALAPRYCAALDAERTARRGEPVDPDALFGDCPALAEQVLVPADRDGNGRFETLQILLAPYVAGPYVEGDYEVNLAFEAGDLTEIPGLYRDDFEVPGPDFTPPPEPE